MPTRLGDTRHGGIDCVLTSGVLLYVTDQAPDKDCHFGFLSEHIRWVFFADAPRREDAS